MKQRKKWGLVILTLCCFILTLGYFSQTSSANTTTTFQKKLDDFTWSLGEQHEQKLASSFLPEEIMASYQDNVQVFVDKHHQDYLKARTESLKKWQVPKISYSGFKQISSNVLDQHAQNLSQTSLPGISNENLLTIQHWKILNVEAMSNIITSYSFSHLIRNSLNFPDINFGSLARTNYLFGMRYAAVPLENDVWEIWSYSQGLAYKYKWDLSQN